MTAATAQSKRAFIALLAIAQFLWLYVLNTLPASTAGLSTLLNPVLGILFASLQLAERPNRSKGTGIVIIVMALALNVLQAMRPKIVKAP